MKTFKGIFDEASRRFRSAAGHLRRQPAHRHLAWGAGFLILASALTIVSVAVNSGSARTLAAGSISRTADVRGGHFTEARLMRASTGLSPYAAGLADRQGRGLQGWTPTGVEGWEIYDLSNPTLMRRQLSYDDARAFNALILPSGFPIIPMEPFVVPRDSADYARALDCLTQAVYYEAGFESGEGQQAVAQVVLNRVRHPAYPRSVCGVVYQGSQRTTGCQFSFTCDGSLARPPAEAAWQRSRAVAQAALGGFVHEGVGTATHYHADYVLPYWAVTLVKLNQIGAHIFYRITGPMGAPGAYTATYAGNEAVIDASVLLGGDARTPDAPTLLEAAAEAEPQAQPRLITLTTGGETRTYVVGSPAALAAAPLADSLPPGAALDLGAKGRDEPQALGALVPSRRAPTAEEVRDINERIRQLQMKEMAGGG